MSVTSKSPLAVIRTAHRVAEESLPAYSHACSPKKFTQHQLFACLVLKDFLKVDYRGLTALLTDCSDLCEAIDLEEVPHYTTLQKAAHRLLAAPQARRLLATTVRRHMGRKKRVKRAAMDSTGLESSPASPYFVRRRAATGSPWKSMVYHRFPRLAMLCKTDSHFVLGYRSGRGPFPDVVDFQPLLSDTLGRVSLDHGGCRRGVRFGSQPCIWTGTLRRPHGHPCEAWPGDKRPAAGKYRRLMQSRFDRVAYRSRCQVETVVSMIKRRQGSFLRSRTYWSQCRDLRLKVLVHNIMILRRK